MRNMVIRRTAIRLLAWLALGLLATRAVAQPAHSNLNYQDVKPTYELGNAEYSDPVPGPHANFLGFNPVDFEPFVRPFGPAETSGYGNGPRPKVGFFGSFERVYWVFSKPQVAVVGSETAGGFVQFNTLLPTTLRNTVDTGEFEANPAWGNRIELGYIDTNDYGWLASVLDHVSQGQFHQYQNAQVLFDDPLGYLNTNLFTIFNLGKFPPIFQFLNLKNVTRLNGLELMRLYRAPRMHNGGYFDVMYGVRFLQLDDTFSVTTTNCDYTNDCTGLSAFVFNPLADSRWSTRAQNNMIGPQIGLRWSHQRQRWIWSSEARFLAAANFQNVTQKYSLGTNTAPDAGTFLVQSAILPGLGGTNHQYTTLFSPVGELRLQVAYQVTSNIALKFGYTGLAMGNITRASNRVDYSGPNLISILPGGIHQTFYSNGINFGVELNR